MDRRRLLATLSAGLAGLAGCQTGSEQTPPSESDGNDASTPTASPAATDTPTATPSDSPADTPTETPEPTPAGEELAAESIQAADEHLQAAVDEYVEFAGSQNGSWLAVDASVAVDPSALSQPLQDAESELEEARTQATGAQQDQIDALDRIREYLDLVVRASSRAHRLWQATRDVVDEAIREDWSRMDDAATAGRQHATELDGLLEDVHAATESGDAEHTAALTPSQIEDKHAQFATGHDAATRCIDAVPGLEDGLDFLASGFDRYQEGRYDVAASDFRGASIEFDSVQSDLPGDAPASYAPIVGDADCYLAAVGVAAEELETAADRSGSNPNEAATVEALEGCSLVDVSPTARRIRDAL